MGKNKVGGGPEQDSLNSRTQKTIVWDRQHAGLLPSTLCLVCATISNYVDHSGLLIVLFHKHLPLAVYFHPAGKVMILKGKISPINSILSLT